MAEGQTFDVLIVGAGPAGSLAAERLARSGKRVALFDGRAAGDPKACGGGVTAKALKAWPHLLEAAGRTVEAVELYSPAGKRVQLKLSEPFAIYSRTALDAHLRERALAAGVNLFAANVSINSEKDGQGNWAARARGRHKGGSAGDDSSEWRAPFLVAADGVNSAIARRLVGALPKSEMEVAFGYRAPLPKAHEAPTVVAFLPGWAGYAWAFPRLDHVSFGIATAQDAFAHSALDDLLWDFMLGYYRQRADPRVPLWSSTRPRDDDNATRNAVRRKRDEGDQSLFELKAGLHTSIERYAARIPGLAPETLDGRRAGADDYALLGDAAGFADPVTGEGIYYALRSAELFADAFLRGQPADYETLWRADFGRELRRASAMRERFYGSFLGAPFTDRMIAFARLHPGIRRTLRELIAGEQGYTNLKQILARRTVSG